MYLNVKMKNILHHNEGKKFNFLFFLQNRVKPIDIDTLTLPAFLFFLLKKANKNKASLKFYSKIYTHPVPWSEFLIIVGCAIA